MNSVGKFVDSDGAEPDPSLWTGIPKIKNTDINELDLYRFSSCHREAAKKLYFFSGPATKRGGVVSAWPLKTKF